MAPQMACSGLYILVELWSVTFHCRIYLITWICCLLTGTEVLKRERAPMQCRKMTPDQGHGWAEPTRVHVSGWLKHRSFLRVKFRAMVLVGLRSSARIKIFHVVFWAIGMSMTWFFFLKNIMFDLSLRLECLDSHILVRGSGKISNIARLQILWIVSLGWLLI